MEFHKSPADLLEVHRTTPYATLITKQNGGRDHIGARKNVDIFKDPMVILPVGWTWLCGFYTAPENAGADKRCARIGIYEQRIDFLQHTPGNLKTIEIILSKFKCRVSRITGGDHNFTKDQ